MVVGSGQALPRNLFTIHYHLFVDLAGHRAGTSPALAPQSCCFRYWEMESFGGSEAIPQKSSPISKAPKLPAAKAIQVMEPCGALSRPQFVISSSCQRSNPEGFGTCDQLGSPMRWPQHVPSIIVGKRRGAFGNSDRPEPPKGRLRPMFTGTREVFRLFSSCR